MVGDPDTQICRQPINDSWEFRVRSFSPSVIIRYQLVTPSPLVINTNDLPYFDRRLFHFSLSTWIKQQCELVKYNLTPSPLLR